jgi:chemotaxis family two-component system sensor kinase Cph1
MSVVGKMQSTDLDLANCDREPIQIPGSIQPHGVLLVVRVMDLTILQAAGDTAGLLGLALEDVLSSTLREIFAADEIERLLPALRRQRDAIVYSERFPSPKRVGKLVDVHAHLADTEFLVVEVEEALDQRAHRPPFDALELIRKMLARLSHAPDLSDFYQIAAEEVRRVVGFDRVMVYRFEADGSGAVVAEDRRPDLDPYLGLRYPASDIPRQARELYRKNWIRLIVDSAYTAAPLHPAVLTAADGTPRAPLDMTFCGLRSVSPVHLEYLRNMGVGASMSLSILAGDELWGLIACHHASPRFVAHDLRVACELFAQIFSLQLESKLRAREYEYQAKMRNAQTALIQRLAPQSDVAGPLMEELPNLLNFIRSDGVAVVAEGRIALLGCTPDENSVRALPAWLDGVASEGVYDTDRLATVNPAAVPYAADASGILALCLPGDVRAYIVWFRREQPRTVNWAGDPAKPVEAGAQGGRLTPRKSFANWQETMRGSSEAWKPLEREGAQSLRLSLLDVVLRNIEETARARQAAQQRQGLLVAELDHRVKNTLANIRALVRHSKEGAVSLEAFTRGFERRIQAMAHAHSLLTQSRWEGASIRAIIADELAPYRAENQGNAIRLTGADLVLRPRAALGLSLAIHELTTNAAKYGALSTPSGTVDVAWRLMRSEADGDKRDLRLRWHESGGPPVDRPQRRGFGSVVIERGMAYELGGTVDLRFDPLGVTCDIVLPGENFFDGTDRSGGQSATHDHPSDATKLGARAPRVLVVEDSLLVTLDIEAVLRKMKWRIAGPAARASQALELAATQELDAAVLDLNLDGALSFETADVLRRRGIPFLFETGYQGSTVIPERFRDVPVVWKPFEPEDLEKALRALLSR